jgi:hypothetical protein
LGLGLGRALVGAAACTRGVLGTSLRVCVSTVVRPGSCTAGTRAGADMVSTRCSGAGSAGAEDGVGACSFTCAWAVHGGGGLWSAIQITASAPTAAPARKGTKDREDRKDREEALMGCARVYIK